MDWMNQVRGVLGKYADQLPGKSTVTDVSAAQSDFDLVVKAAPRQNLVDGLRAAIQSPNTPPFAEMVARVYRESEPRHKAAVLNILASVTPASAPDEFLAFAGRNREISPEDAGRLAPEKVARLAEAAERANPGVVDRVAEYYADHPKLAKNMGIQAIAAAIARIGQPARGRSSAGKVE